MRARTGCQPCRDRHIKCVRRPEAEACEKCLENRRECINVSVHRFKPVRTVTSKGKDGQSWHESLAHDSSQVWVDVPPFIDFVGADDNGMSREDSDPPLASSDNVAHSAVSAHNAAFDSITNDASDTQQAWDVEHPLTPMHTANAPPNQEQHYSTMQAPTTHGSYTVHNQITTSPLQHTRSPGTMRHQFSPKAGTISFEALHRTNSNRTIQHSSPGVSTHSSMRPGILGLTPSNQASPTYSLSVTWPFQTEREARLFHHYIKRISPWIDVLDSSGYFGVEIPRRAAYQPLIANAIYAISSLHLSLLDKTEDRESPHYVDESLQHLKQILEDPLGHADENLLAGVILLRSHEEMSDRDDNVHLLGGQRLLNSIASYAADGGFKESASWISLRQHIYISLTRQSPLGLNLSNYEHSSVFVDQSDEAWANRAVFLFACVLNYAFGSAEDNTAGTAAQQQDNPLRPQHQQPDLNRRAELEEKVEAWNRSKPWYFSALWPHSSSSTTATTNTASPNPTPSDHPHQHQTPHKQQQQHPSPWPTVYTSHPSHAVGLQYHALSKIVLAIYDPRLTKLGFDGHVHRLRKQADATVLHHLRFVVGVAVSNPDVTNAMFQGSHILAACGSYLVDPREQDAAVEFLRGMQASMGWRTGGIVEALRGQWAS